MGEVEGVAAGYVMVEGIVENNRITATGLKMLLTYNLP